ncbi:MAG: outer membrane efflux protein [uncultured bacterium]|nr:MAG: outer membrane efflux protein [uncultured bacterium]
MKNVKIIYFLMMVFLSGLTNAHALTLGDAIARVLNQHPDLAMAQTDVKIAKKEKHISSWLPDAKAKIDLEEIPANNSSLGNADMTSYGVSQEIPFPLTLTTQAKKGAALVKSMQYANEGVKRNLIYETTKTYIELLMTQKQLALRREVLGIYKQLSTSLESEYKASSGHTPINTMTGEKTEKKESFLGDVFMAKMKVAENETAIDDLMHQTESLKAKLNLMMGNQALEKMTPLTPLPVKNLKITAAELEQKLTTQNSDLNSLKWLIEKSRQDKNLAKLALVPTLEPEFAYNQRQNRENAITVGMGLNLPIWINRNSAEIKKGQLEEYKSRLEFNQKQLSLKQELYDLYNHAKQHVKIVRKYRDEVVPLAKSAFNVTQASFNTGNTDTRDLLQKMINYLEASKMYWDLWSDYQIEYALLEQITGEPL